MKKKRILGRLLALACAMALLTACGTQKRSVKEKDDHLTVYLWNNNMMEYVVPYIKEQIPDQKIEFIVGNNNVDLYNYFAEHGDLPDIITTRRFSQKDVEALQPYLLDMSAYDVVSEFYPYALQYYADSDGAIKWLPVCGIPETMIANKSLFDRYGIEIPKNYEELKECCAKLHEKGVKPYSIGLAMDWAAHSLIQGAAIDQFSSIDGIEWRSSIESSLEEEAFHTRFWNRIFAEVKTFLEDTYLTAEDLDCDLETARERFVHGKTAMFRGTPSVMEYLKANMDSELVRLPYFSQTSDESWIYTYPSLNIALNKELENREEKLNLAMKVLDCFLSEEGQRLVADGNGMISYTAHVGSSFEGMTGVEEQVKNNAFYIRYASNGSFSGSLQAVKGLLSGQMDEREAYETFQRAVCGQKEPEPSVIEFQKQYDIALNNRCGRDAASSILTTVRKDQNVELAFSSYCYYTSSIYAGSCTATQARMMVAQNDGTFLWSASLTGAQVKELVNGYLTGTEGNFRPTNPYELPVASGMKLILEPEADHFKLKEIELEGHSIDDSEKYEIMLTNDVRTVLKTLYPDMEIKNLDVKLENAWSSVLTGGQQPCAPEDYIEVTGNAWE